ncbi:MAG: DedA family protein [Gammaproteobacteria bacterium]
MENFLPETLVLWLTQYGSLALFFLLTIGIFALPIPDETLMVFAGALIAHQKLDLFPTYLAAILGACCGITLSYIIGRTAGVYILKKYGGWVRITEAKMQKIHEWFEKIGRWALFIGYFIPGVRHLTGYAAGISALAYRQFALFSYSGAVIWAVTFLTLGYFLGNRWPYISALFEESWTLLLIALIPLLILGTLYWRFRVRKKRQSFVEK